MCGMAKSSVGAHFLEDALSQFRKYKKLADGALVQLSDEDFFRAPDPGSNSAALVLKHLAGNMRSRWTDFRGADGERPDRDRDSEFERAAGDSRASLTERWEAGWALLFEALAPIREDELQETVTIRGEPHSVLEAIQRQLTHYAYHVGQIVFLAKHFAGERWRSLSIPKGRSRDFDVAKSGSPYTLR
jgi:hypothetical protein